MKHTLGQLWLLAKHPLRIALGVFLILLGIAGLILPIMPGWILIFPGLALAAPNNRLSRWLRHKAHRLRCRLHPDRHCRPRDFCGK